ncbi:hypothetical protein [Tsukamurella pseudospumae]|nr:hypothetical protein [Tsukamurella pseudospumae]
MAEVSAQGNDPLRGRAGAGRPAARYRGRTAAETPARTAASWTTRWR